MPLFRGWGIQPTDAELDREVSFPAQSGPVGERRPIPIPVGLPYQAPESGRWYVMMSDGRLECRDSGEAIAAFCAARRQQAAERSHA